MNTSSKKILNEVKDYVMIFIGLLSYCFGYTAFVLPEKVVTGGVTGLASLFFFGLGWNVAITYYIINAILLAIAFKTVGKQFVIRTIIGATIATIMLGVMQPLFTVPIVPQETFMNVIIGAVMCGVGLGIVFIHNGSSAGTDIIAAMVNKHSNISASKAYAMMAAMPEADKPIRSIHAKLRSQGIWVWTRGAIEEHLGLEAKNETAWSNFIERSKSQNFVRNLPDYEGITELCKWIIDGSRET